MGPGQSGVKSETPWRIVSRGGEVFDDTLSITVPDPDHSFDEARYVIVGVSHEGRLLIVSHAERGDHIRIISARELTRDERSAYEEGDFT